MNSEDRTQKTQGQKLSTPLKILEAIAAVLTIIGYWISQPLLYITSSVVALTVILIFLLGQRGQKRGVGICLLCLLLILGSLFLYYKRHQASMNDSLANMALRYEEVSERSVKLHAISQETGEELPVEWTLSSAPGCKISEAGLFETDGTPCSAVVTARLIHDGKTYEASQTAVVDTVELASEDSKKANVKFFDELPAGMNYDSPDFSRLKTDYGIYSSKENALQSVGCTSQDECTDETTCGFLFYHWCRGTDEVASYTAEDFFTSSTPKSEVKQYPHNRLSMPEKTSTCTKFTCFYKEKQDVTLPFYSPDDGSGCVWMPNYSACWDSYWYWVVEIHECTITMRTSATKISVQ